jgi:Protein of unknown function (DUF3108)
MKFFRSAAASALVFALFASAPGAEAETLRVRYAVALLGLPLGTANLTGTLTPESYRLDASAKLGGLASIMGKSTGAATASGAIVNGQLAPAAYATTASNAKETRTVRMAISGGAVSGLDVSPPFEEKPGRVPLTEASKRNIVDPLGAVLMTVPQGQPLLSKAACERSIPVFDGATRFDITLAFRELRKVKASGYEGDVVVCGVRYTPLAGHRPERKATKFMTDNKKIEVWLAPVERAHALVPYYISVATQIGTATLTAEEFQLQPGK